MVAVGYDEKFIDVFDPKSGQKIKSLYGHEHFTFGLSFDDSGRYLASGNQDKTVRIWDVRKTDEAVHVLPMVIGPAGTVRFAKNSKRLLAAEYSNYIHCYDVENNFKMESQVDFFGEIMGLDLNRIHTEVYVAIGDSGMGVSGGILRLALGPQMQPILPDELEEY